MLDLILQLLIIIPIFYFTQFYKSIVFLSFAIDSLFSAAHFIKIFILNDTSQKDILSNINKLYTIDIINRYIYYITLEIIYLTLCNLFWLKTILPLYYILLLTICPVILNHICHNYLSKYINFINEEKKKFIRVIICKQLSSVINTLSKICINKDPNINFNELLFLFDDYDKTIGDFLLFLKNFLIISLIHYTRKKSNLFYGKLITYFYNYKTGDLIESLDLQTAKKRFTEVIIKREWSRLLSTEILQSIIYIYSLQNDNKVDYVTIYITKFNYTLIKMFTIWTIGAFLDKSYILPLLSIFFLMYKKRISTYLDKEQLYKYCFRLLALIIGIFLKNHFMVAFICEFGYALTFNKIMFSIMRYIYEKSERILHISIHCNRYNIFMITTFIYIQIIKFLNNYVNFEYEYHILNYTFMMININNNYKRIIGTLLILLGMISNYNEFHMCYILGISYLCLNLDDHFSKDGNSTLSILKQKINPNIISSYYQKKNSNIYIGNIDNRKISSSINPSPPTLFNENKYLDKEVNVKILDDDVNLMESYILSQSKVHKKS